MGSFAINKIIETKTYYNNIMFLKRSNFQGVFMNSTHFPGLNFIKLKFHDFPVFP